MRAQGFLKGGAPRSESAISMIAGGNHTISSAFSECPLESPSFGTFLGDQEKYMMHVVRTTMYSFLYFVHKKPPELTDCLFRWFFAWI